MKIKKNEQANAEDYLKQLPSILFADKFQEMDLKEIIRRNDDPTLNLMPGYTRSSIISILFEHCIQKIIREGWDINDEPHFKKGLVDLAHLCYANGIHEEDAVKWTFIHLMKAEKKEEIAATFRSVYLMKKAIDFGKKPCMTKEQKLTFQMEEFLKRRFDIRYNTMKMQNEFIERRSFSIDYRPLERRQINGICIRAHKEGLELWDKDILRFLDSDYVPLFNPLESYLKGLPKWNGKDYIRAVARQIPCKDPKWEDLFYKWFVSMTAHWMNEDNKHANSVSPLLTGPQGCGKSTWCASLMPKELKDYYTDGFDMSSKRKAELNLTRFGLINFDEFDSITENQQAYLKHILQKAVVKTAVPHKSIVQSLRRYASFIGTSNNRELLTDPTGSRRFICIEVTGRIRTERSINYPQLYAQAVEAVRSGLVYWFSAEEEKSLMQSNEAFTQQSTEEQLFLKYFEIAGKNETCEWMTSADILTEIERLSKKKFGNTRFRYFGRILRKLHVETRRRSDNNYFGVRKKY